MATQNSLDNRSAPFTVTTGNLTVTSGNLTLPDTSSTIGQITINALPVLHAYGNGTNFFAGRAGNFTLTTATATQNTGVGRAALGDQAGFNYVSSESSNITIGSIVLGTAAESNTTRIGNQGSGSGQQNKCFISGITGATVTGSAVLCATDGQLGTVVSSVRYKENIQDLDDSRFISLRPVTFNLKSDATHAQQYGFIAEEVADIMPELVIYNSADEPEAVKYHQMYALLLNEIQKLNKRIHVLENNNGNK